jgi:quercetin dioxygenase-like cupin family protein
MRNRIFLAALGMAVAATSMAQTPAGAPAHGVVTPDSLTWGPGPPALPKGLQIAVLAGNPGEAGPFTLRAKMPAGYTIAPHSHPTDENLTVLSGELMAGMGDTIEPAKMQAMGPGAYALMASPMHHYVRAKSETVVQVHGTGPFTITYVNPADDPRNAAPAK